MSWTTLLYIKNVIEKVVKYLFILIFAWYIFTMTILYAIKTNNINIYLNYFSTGLSFGKPIFKLKIVQLIK